MTKNYAGGCFCGAIRLESTGEPVASALCHCTDCRRLTGCAFTYNLLVPSSALEVLKGTPKKVPKTADSGIAIVNYFCGDCGTPLFGHSISSSGTPDGMTVVRAGVSDNVDPLNQRKPEVEIYTERRLRWVAPAEGAGQVEGMLSTSG